MYIFFALILFLPMLALRRRTDSDTRILDSKSTTSIKGILCIYVMLHNLLGDPMLPKDKITELFCEHAGGVGVGLFFFLSAYGIIRAYQAQGNRSLIRLLFVHIPKMWCVAVFINVITYLKFMRGEFETVDMWLRILNLDLFNGGERINLHGWYVASIIALYIIFAAVYFVCSKLRTEKKFIIAACIMASVAIGFRLAAVQTDYARLYTRELPAFAIGCLYAAFYDKINAFASKHFKLGIFLSVGTFLVFYLPSEPVATYAAAIIIIFVSQRYTYYSKVTHFLGKICLGVYLFVHYSSLVLKQYLLQEYLWVLLNAGFVIEVAIMIHSVQYAIDYSVYRVKNWIVQKFARKDKDEACNDSV